MAHLGIVPDWQFSMDPRINPLINPYANIPAGWQSQSRPPQVAGIHITPSGPDQLGFTNPFDSFWWRNRKKLIIGGLLAAGVVGVIGISAVLK